MNWKFSRIKTVSHVRKCLDDCLRASTLSRLIVQFQLLQIFPGTDTSTVEGLRLFSQQHRKRYLKSQHNGGKTRQQNSDILDFFLPKLKSTHSTENCTSLLLAFWYFTVSWWSDNSFFLFFVPSQNQNLYPGLKQREKLHTNASLSSLAASFTSSQVWFYFLHITNNRNDRRAPTQYDRIRKGVAIVMVVKGLKCKHKCASLLWGKYEWPSFPLVWEECVCVGGKSPPCNCCTAADTLVKRGAESRYKTYSSELRSDPEQSQFGSVRPSDCFLEQTMIQPAEVFFFLIHYVNS